MVAHPIVLVWIEDGPGGKDAAQRAQLEFAPWRKACPLAKLQVGRARSEYGDVFLVDDLPQCLWPFERPVIEDQYNPGGERGELPVPHPPAARGLKEQLVARPQITMQPVLLEVFQQCAT